MASVKKCGFTQVFQHRTGAGAGAGAAILGVHQQLPSLPTSSCRQEEEEEEKEEEEVGLCRLPSPSLCPPQSNVVIPTL